MAEVYPSDSELINIQSDTETGVEYIPTGTAPYYLQFRKLLYRLLLASQRANDLRVFDEGGLDIGVKPGKFWLATQLISYAGSSGNTLADDKQNIYIYLDSSATLVTDEYSGFPDMVTTPHIRLAQISTSAGDIDSITDCRTGHNIVMPYGAGGLKKTIEAHTSDDTLTTAESGSVHSNLRRHGNNYTYPSRVSSRRNSLQFRCTSRTRVADRSRAAAIRDDSGQTADKYKSASAVGACLSLIADTNGEWATIAKNGTWTEEA